MNRNTFADELPAILDAQPLKRAPRQILTSIMVLDISKASHAQGEIQISFTQHQASKDGWTQGIVGSSDVFLSTSEAEELFYELKAKLNR